MSKQPLSDVGEDDLPPPYTPTASDEGLFASHLRRIQPLAQDSQASGDGHVLATLIQPIESFLQSIPGMQPAPKHAEAVLVPADAVSPKWTLTDQMDNLDGEVKQVVRVKAGKASKDGARGAGSPDAGGSSSRGTGEFDSWGRWDDGSSSDPGSGEALWWSDEELAERLAKRLQPPRETMSRERRSIWPRSAISPAAQQAHVSMEVHADEVTFRKENEMGIWESKSGWGIVVHVRLKH